MERLAAPHLPDRGPAHLSDARAEHVRHRRPAAPEVVLRRLLSIDYVRRRAGDVSLYVQTDEDETVSAVRTWGSQHSALWAALLAAGRAVEVVLVGRDPVRLAAAGRVLDQWAATPPESVTLSQQEAATELAAIKKAVATSDWTALEVYGGLNLPIKACVRPRRRVRR